jgi:hypothetical protein
MKIKIIPNGRVVSPSTSRLPVLGAAAGDIVGDEPGADRVDVVGRNVHEDPAPVRGQRQEQEQVVARLDLETGRVEPSVNGSPARPHRKLVLQESAGSSSIAFKPSTFPNREKPVTSQVTTTPGNTRPGTTRSDTDIYLACSNPTRCDVIRRNRHAW